MKRLHLRDALCAWVLLFTTSTHATLIDNGNGLIYDDDLNITWLADANYAQTSGFDADGKMSWNAAVSWVGSLTYAGHSNWRLPTAVSCPGNSPNLCAGTGSELNHLFYNELGGSQGTEITSSGDPDLALFSNIQSAYWSTPERDTSSAWIFYMASSGLSGQQSWADKTPGNLYAWAVADGNISAVPIPATVWLFASGLVGLFGLARRRRVTA